MLRSSLIQVFPLSILVRTVPTWQQLKTSSRHPQQFSVLTVTRIMTDKCKLVITSNFHLLGPARPGLGSFYWPSCLFEGKEWANTASQCLILSYLARLLSFSEKPHQLSYQDICNKVSGLDLSVIWKLQIISAGINNNQVAGQSTRHHFPAWHLAGPLSRDARWQFSRLHRPSRVVLLPARRHWTCGVCPPCTVTSQETLDLWSLSSLSLLPTLPTLNSLLGHEKSLRFYIYFVKRQK